MNIIGFVEGVREDSGGQGLVGVPLIHQSLAARGHSHVLAVGGRAMPSAKPFLRCHLDDLGWRPSWLRVVEFRAWGKWSFAPGLVASMARHVRNADFVMLHSLYSFPVLAGYSLARAYGKPYGVWPHGVLAPWQRCVGRRKKGAYDFLVARRILDEASVLFYSAAGERDEVAVAGVRTPSIVIPHGVNASSYEILPARGGFRARFLAGHDGPLVLHLGRLAPKKGLDLLVDSMASVQRRRPDVSLAIVGGGTSAEVAQVHRWIAERRIESSTVVTGPLDDWQKLQALADADVFVLPSQAENFAFAMFEAMSSGLPVIVSETLNYAAQVKRADAGLVIRRDARDLRDAILTLIDDPARGHLMGMNGRELAKRYSWETSGELAEKAISSLVRGLQFSDVLDPA